MTSLQEIKRKNGTKVHFAYFPESFLQDLSWQKGDEIQFEIKGSELLVKKVNL